MNVTPQQQQALITFLSRRLPDWDQRSKVAQRALLPEAQFAGDPQTGWSTLIAEAIDKERLPQLIKAAASVAPDDADLALLAEEAARGELVVPFNLPDRRLLFAGAALFLALGLGGAVVLGGGLLFGSSGGDDPVAAEATADVEPASDAVVPPSVDTDPGLEAEATPESADVADSPSEPVAGEPAVEAAPTPEPEPEPEPKPKAEPKPVPSPKTAGVDNAGPHCAKPAGQVVGYAFFAMERPSFPGDVWELSRDLNVRKQFPSKENHWSTDSPVVCVLLNGTRLKVEAEPVRVAGGAWWVPVVGGAATPPN